MKLKQIGTYFILAVAGGVVALLLQNVIQNSSESIRSDNRQNNMIPAQLSTDFGPIIWISEKQQITLFTL